MAKKRKRSNGQGTIYQADGKWIAQVSYYDKDGKLKRPKRVCKKHADALVRLDELREQAKRLDMDEQHHTVKSFLISWLGDSDKTSLSTSTYISYHKTIHNHIIPKIGRSKLATLKAGKVRSMIAKLQDDGLGSRSIELSYVVLNAALNQAYKDDVIAKNPCLSVKKPVHKSEECVPFTKEERDLIFEEARGDYFYPLFKIMLSTGIRSSEAFGLHWDQVDPAGKTIRIIQQHSRGEIRPLKSKHSVRTLDITSGISEMLELQKEQSREYGFEDKPQVFPGKRGAYLDVVNFGKANWTPLLMRAGVRPRGLHHLRHTFATELLGNNVPVHVVSRLLGHSSPTITYNIYAHVIPVQQSQAADKIQEIFG